MGAAEVEHEPRARANGVRAVEGGHSGGAVVGLVGLRGLLHRAVVLAVAGLRRRERGRQHEGGGDDEALHRAAPPAAQRKPMPGSVITAHQGRAAGNLMHTRTRGDQQIAVGQFMHTAIATETRWIVEAYQGTGRGELVDAFGAAEVRHQDVAVGCARDLFRERADCREIGLRHAAAIEAMDS